MDTKAIGRRIKNIRLQQGMTTEKFAKIFHERSPSKGTISKWENGHYLPNNDRLKRIAEVGETTVDYLLNGSIEDAILSEINVYLDNQEGIELSQNSRKRVTKEALQNSLKNPIINTIYGDENEANLFRSCIHDEIRKATMRLVNHTDFTNNGFIRFTTIGLENLENEMQDYLNNGISADLYNDTINIINNAKADILDLIEKDNIS